MGDREQRFIMDQQDLILPSSSRADATAMQRQHIGPEAFEATLRASPDNPFVDTLSASGRTSRVHSPAFPAELDAEIGLVGSRIQEMRQTSAHSTCWE